MAHQRFRRFNAGDVVTLRGDFANAILDELERLGRLEVVAPLRKLQDDSGGIVFGIGTVASTGSSALPAPEFTYQILTGIANRAVWDVLTFGPAIP